MKHKNIAALAKLGLFSLLMMLTTTAVNAQKQFTLEDLNFGGKNYHNMVPKNRYLTWWGDQLVRTDTEECSLVNKKTGKETVMLLLTTSTNGPEQTTAQKSVTCSMPHSPIPKNHSY